MSISQGMYERLENVEVRYVQIETELSQPDVINDLKKYASLNREFDDLQDIVTTWRKYKVKLADKEQANDELKINCDEPETVQWLQDELTHIENELVLIEDNLKHLLVPSDPRDKKDVILEIRGAAGGDEAALFAGDLLRMYLRFGEIKGWSSQIISENTIGIGGYKEVVVEIKGKRVYSYLRFESGVHRVQRIPVTESGGRIHTSTVTVAVLPEAEGVEVDIKESDLKIDTYRASGAGGQHVNKTSSAIRITHLPTNLVITCQDERSQLQNKEKAMKILAAKLLQAQEEQATAESGEERRNQVGSGDRGEKIRTYNFPENRVTDHRIGLSLYNLRNMLEGDLLPLSEALRADYEAKRLAKGD